MDPQHPFYIMVVSVTDSTTTQQLRCAQIFAAFKHWCNSHRVKFLEMKFLYWARHVSHMWWNSWEMGLIDLGLDSWSKWMDLRCRHCGILPCSLLSPLLSLWILMLALLPRARVSEWASEGSKRRAPVRKEVKASPGTPDQQWRTLP